MRKSIFLDTNIFLHYQPFTQINWLELTQSDLVTLVIPPITIRELNKHKDSHPRPQIKKRATDTIKKLTELFSSGNPANISNNIQIFIEDRDPNINYIDYHLDEKIQDDQLIASILSLKNEHPEINIVLFTSDFGLTLIAKAHRQYIDHIEMPEIYRIAPEPDPNVAKIRTLEQQLREYNSRTPKLTLVFQNGKNLLSFKLHPPIALSQTDILKRTNEMKNKLLMLNTNEIDTQLYPKTSPQENISRSVRASLMGFFAQEELDRYRDEVEKFLEEYTKYVINDFEFKNRKMQTIKFEIDLVNDGNMPADDIDIALHFPKGYKLLQESELPESPRIPEPPEKPKLRIQSLINPYSRFDANLWLNDFGIPEISTVALTNTSSPKIINNNEGVNCFIHVNRVKHNMLEHIDPMFVIMDTTDKLRSFMIDYDITAANISKKIQGNLHVKIQKA